MPVLHFTVPGTPQPKQRPRRTADGVWYTPRSTRRYEDRVAGYALAAGARWRPGTYSVTVALYFPDRRRRDLDNCVKALLDGLNGVVWADDAEVTQLHVSKHLDPHTPRAEVVVRPAALSTTTGQSGV
ncbi:RusA family crossover junction endodeoxyribonuclease [Candidatus Latescibacterota bacterium]